MRGSITFGGRAPSPGASRHPLPRERARGGQIREIENTVQDPAEDEMTRQPDQWMAPPIFFR